MTAALVGVAGVTLLRQFVDVFNRCSTPQQALSVPRTWPLGVLTNLIESHTASGPSAATQPLRRLLDISPSVPRLMWPPLSLYALESPTANPEHLQWSG